MDQAVYVVLMMLLMLPVLGIVFYVFARLIFHAWFKAKADAEKTTSWNGTERRHRRCDDHGGLH